MSREILFRGKRVDNGEWVEGNLTINEAAKAHRIVVGFGLTGDMEDECHVCFGEFHLVDPSTIGQYTGLNDKNGVKIFEGDIMKWSKNVEVMFGKGMFGARLPSTNYPNSMISLEKLEVVGNRFDNPELTKQS